MNKEYLTYIIIGTVAVIIITFLINSNQPKQEITSLPGLTLPPSNSETINSINIYDLSNDSILKPTTPPVTPQSIPQLTPQSIPQLTPQLTPQSIPQLTPITTLSPTTTLRPAITTLSPATTTLSPATTTLSPATTTLSPAQRTLIDIVKKQKELERRLKEQQEEDLFNIPLIPVFYSNNDIEYIANEGYYQINQFYELTIPFFHPCYDIGPAVNGISTGWLYGGKLGSLLDNNDKTGVVTVADYCRQQCIDIPGVIVCNNNGPYFDKYSGTDKPPLIIITMPVLKTFRGKLKLTFNSPPHITGVIPNIRINTADNFTSDLFRSTDQEISRMLRYRTKPWLETFNLQIDSLDSSKSASWNLNFTKPFRCIIFEITSCKQQGHIWMTSINFEKSR